MSRITIKNYALRVEADLAKLRLDSLGIKSDIVAIDGVFSGALGGFELKVEELHAQRALHFIEEYERDLKLATDKELPDDFDVTAEESQ